MEKKFIRVDEVARVLEISESKNQPTFTGDKLRKIREKQEVL